MTRFSMVTNWLVTLCFFIAQANATPGHPGTLDQTFGMGGRASVNISLRSDVAYAMALQPDGKIVLAGTCDSFSYGDFCAARYNIDGTLDTTFGVDGLVFEPVGPGADYGYGLAIQPDGKLVLAGHCFATVANFCAMRLNTNGSRDENFGSMGRVLTPFDTNEPSARAVALQSDGKLVLAGGCSPGVFCAIRYNGNGTVDTNFGASGTVITPVGSSYAKANALIVQPDGKIVLAGSCGNGTDNDNDFCAIRYRIDGSLDNSFGQGGKIVVPVGLKYDAANAVALQPDGKLVLAGACTIVDTLHFCAARLMSDGSIDGSFGSGGKIITQVSVNGGLARALVLQPDGKMLLVGECNGAAGFDFCMLRYTDNGAPDGTFGENGKIIAFMTNGIDVPYAAALQPDGKLVVAGYCAGLAADFCVARFDGGPFGYKNCTLDIDGDNRVLAATDSLIHARIALGITGNAVVNGITFPETAKRTTWPLIRDYLVTQCGISLRP